MAGAAGARLALLVAMVALLHVCAIRDSYDSDAVLNIKDQEDKEVAQQQEVDLDTAALLGDHPVSQDELRQKVAEYEKGNATQLFVKNEPVAALALPDENAVASIPEKISALIGVEDRAKYKDGPKGVIGGAVILQFKVKSGQEATPDFYLIEPEKWKSTYAEKPVEEMEKGNAGQYAALQKFLGDGPRPEGLTAALKTVPTEMVLFSKLGFPVADAVVIKTLWGTQEKLAGVDAYLAIERGPEEGDLDSYYKCEIDKSTGLPEKYTSADDHKFSADAKEHT
jgi:hypothetical protein